MYTVKVIDEEGNETVLKDVLQYDVIDKNNIISLAQQTAVVPDGKNEQAFLDDVVSNVEDLLVDEEEYPSPDRVAELVDETVNGLTERNNQENSWK